MPDTNFVLPDYEGRSIVNFSAGIVKHFGGKTSSSPYPFCDDNVDLSGVDKIVVFIVDAFVYNKASKILRANKDFKFINQSSMKKMTSVFPSTTSAALTSFFTGEPPGIHGMLGYTLFLKEYGCLTNMIELCPLNQERDGMARLGLDPLKFLPVPTVFELIGEQGVKGYHVTSKSFVNTGFSRMHSKGGSVKGTYGIGDTIEEIYNIIKKGRERSLTFVYWGIVDTFGHKYGPNSTASDLEAYWFLKAVDEFFGTLKLKKVAFFITADHGQIDTTWKNEIWWTKHDEPFPLLYSVPGGEHRAAYMYTGYAKLLKEKLQELYGKRLYLLTKEEAIEANLFGRFDNNHIDRLGELLILPTEDRAFCYKYTGQEHSMKGRHGGLTRAEMEVPLIFMRR